MILIAVIDGVGIYIHEVVAGPVPTIDAAKWPWVR